ncbi:MAG: GrpB family protein [Pseudonocardiaceae bacterium]
MSDGDAEADKHTEQRPIWATETVRLVEPQPAWASLAEHFIGEIQDLLGHVLSSEVLHIGSTAIPGLPAKPVIDLQALSQDPDTTIANAHGELTARSWFFVPRRLDQRPWRWFIVRAADWPTYTTTPQSGGGARA